MKPSRLLLTTTCYAPFVLCGSHERHQRGPVVRTAEPWYRLWVLRAGEWELAEAGHVTLHVAPCAVLIQPGAKLKLTLHGRTDRQFLDFDVVHQRRVPRKRGGHSLKHADDRRQPLPPAVWGVDLPAIVPASLVDSCMQTVDFCCLHWWRDPVHHARANARLADWLAAYVLSQREPDAAPAGTWRAECQRVARLHLETCLNVERWAALLNISRQHFSARYTAEAGQSPQEYLAELRVVEARRLLADTNLPVKAIALRSGFRSLETFSRFFRHRTGRTPREWRRAQHPTP